MHSGNWSLLPALLIAAAPAQAAQKSVLIERNAYIAPSWADAAESTDVETLYATREEYVAAAGDNDYLLEKLLYRSDGLAVVAYLYHPRGGRKHPVIVFNRGSDGGEGHDELGGADVADLMNVTELIAELPFLDADNVFLYGESRGGMMVAVWPDFADRKDSIVKRRSAIDWPEQLSLPLLLMHGSNDRSVSPAQTLRLAIELARSGSEFGVIVFPGGDHVLTGQRRERDRRAVEHFRHYMVD